VAEAVRAGRVVRLLVDRGARGGEGLRGLLDEAAGRGVSIESVDTPAIEELGVERHQGVVAFVVPPARLDERALASMPFPPSSIAVILDGVEDPQNLGACARSSEAAGAAVMVVRERRAAPLSAAAVRASAGALLHLPVATVVNLHRAVEILQSRRFTVVGLDHRAESSIHEEPPPEPPLAIVVGAEEAGISRLVRESCDLLVAIPMAGKTASLNVSAALAIGLFGYALRPRGHPGAPSGG
jgi:23S rRNA (guanosine2251-2'-O)-methyltransferase